MPNYVILASLTEQGLQHAKQIPAELAAAKKLALKYGVTLPADNLRMLIGGDYDFLAHVQAPDDKVVTEFVLAAGMSGYTMPTIMQSFTEAEINDIFSKL
jgi:uncharacterized protein with GYD domain